MARIVLLGYDVPTPAILLRTLTPVSAALSSSALSRQVSSVKASLLLSLTTLTRTASPASAALRATFSRTSTPVRAALSYGATRTIASVRTALRSTILRSSTPTRASLALPTYLLNDGMSSLSGWGTGIWKANASLTSTAGYDAVIVDGNKMQHWCTYGTNLMLDAPNVISVKGFSATLPNKIIYVSARFNSYHPERVWAYQVLIEFNTGSGSRQAAFHCRLRTGIPYPNNGGDGVYVYDPADMPRRVGSCGYPTDYTQWSRIWGVFDVAGNKYLRIGFTRMDGTGVSYDASAYNLDWEGSAPAGTWNIHLSIAGPSHSNWDSSGNLISGTPTWPYYDDVSGYWDDVKVYYY